MKLRNMRDVSGVRLVVRFARIVAMAAPIIVLAPVATLACAVCWDPSSDDLISRGLNWSVLFLMMMPFTIVGSVGGWLFYKYRARPTEEGGRPKPFQHRVVTREESAK